MKRMMILLSVLTSLWNGGCISQFDESDYLPNALLFKRDNETVVFCVFEHGKTDLYKRFGGSTQKSINTTYFLRTYRAETMEKAAEERWISRDDLEHPSVSILGRSADRVWLFADGLHAFDPFTLKRIADNRLIEERNPQLQGKLPAEKKYYEWNHLDNTVWITAKDGKKWQLDTRTLKASPLIQGPELNALTKDRTYRQLQRLWDSFATGGFVGNQDTVGNYFYGIYDGEEIMRDGANYRNDASAMKDTPRQCWRARLLPSSGKHQPVEAAHAAVVSQNDFLGGAFLLDRRTGKPIRCHAPDGWIVCHRSEAGSDGTLQFSRVDTSGREHWLTQISLSVLTGADIAGGTLLIQGTKPDEDGLPVTGIVRIRLADGDAEIGSY